MPSGVFEDTPRPLDAQAGEHVVVVHNAVHQDARINQGPLAGNAARDTLYVGAFAPINHVRFHSVEELPQTQGVSE